ncbi:MAG: hypothetical protein RM338_16550 [Nostoc sp. DedQUE12a]|nr:hypothetical protein [Nostoc sp. DedQUE12a]
MRVVNGNSQFQLGDGIANNADFGTGQLLFTLFGATFTEADVSTNIDPNSSSVFQFS